MLGVEDSHMACSCGALTPEECHDNFEAILAKEFTDFRLVLARDWVEKIL